MKTQFHMVLDNFSKAILLLGPTYVFVCQAILKIQLTLEKDI